VSPSSSPSPPCPAPPAPPQAAKSQAAAGPAGPNDGADEAYIKKNTELEAQLGDVERKLRLDRLYAKRPPQKVQARVYF
jgi:hypothetical protein